MSDSTPAIGRFIKDLLAERSWSMGHLSTLTHIDKASISRIVNGKRKPTLAHLQQFAESFDVPLTHFLKAAGYPDVSGKAPLDDAEAGGGFIFSQPSTEEIKKKLHFFERQAQTPQGEQKIFETFEGKLEKLDSAGPYIDKLKHFFKQYRTRSGSSKDLALMGAALLYFITPLDVVPDYIFPLGYVDDAMAVQFAFSLLQSKL